jgi:hypothetical protein
VQPVQRHPKRVGRATANKLKPFAALANDSGHIAEQLADPAVEIRVSMNPRVHRAALAYCQSLTYANHRPNNKKPDPLKIGSPQVNP